MRVGAWVRVGAGVRAGAGVGVGAGVWRGLSPFHTSGAHARKLGASAAVRVVEPEIMSLACVDRVLGRRGMGRVRNAGSKARELRGCGHTLKDGATVAGGCGRVGKRRCVR